MKTKRKTKILSLILAITVVATMIMAVPMVSLANHADTGNVLIWDFAEYSVAGDVTTNTPIDYNGLSIVGGNSGDTLKSDGFRANKPSGENAEYISYTPTYDGTLFVTFVSTNNDDAANRFSSIGTAIDYESEIGQNGVLDRQAASKGILSANLKAGTKYYVCTTGGVRYTSVQYKYNKNSWYTTGAVTENDVLVDTYALKLTAIIAGSAAKQTTGNVYNNVTYTSSTNLRGNYSGGEYVKDTDSKGAEKDGTILKIEPKLDGEFSIIYRRQPSSNKYEKNDNKDLILNDSSGERQTAISFLHDDISSSVPEYLAVCSIFKLSAGETYYAYCHGSTLGLYEISYTPEWVANDENGTVEKDVDGIKVSYPANTTGKGFSYDLTDKISGLEGNLSEKTDGILKVSYDLYIPQTEKATANNFFVDLSGDTTINGWGGGNDKTYGRVSGYEPWSDIKAVYGKGKTNDPEGITVSNMGDIRKEGDWAKVEYVYNLKENTFKVTYDGTESETLTGEAVNKTDKLYLNAQPLDSMENGAQSENGVYLKFRNISASYEAAEAPTTKVSFGTHEIDSGYYNVSEVKKGVIRFLQEITGDASEVKRFGFYIVNSSGETLLAAVSTPNDQDEIDGIYADLKNIEENEGNKTNMFYMKAFVDYGNGFLDYGNAFGDKVNWEREVNEPK